MANIISRSISHCKKHKAVKLFLATILFLNLSQKSQEVSLPGSLDGIWQVESYTRKGETLQPEIKVHFLFSEGYFNEICFNKKDPMLNVRFYVVENDIVQMYFDEDHEIKAEEYKISSISQSKLTLELLGDNFLVDNHSSQVFELNRVKPKS
jgi:hypothetical protein